MRFSRRAIVLIAGCGCLLFIAFCVALVLLFFLFTSQDNNVATAPRSSFQIATVVSAPAIRGGFATQVPVRPTPLPVRPATASSRTVATSPRTIVAIEQYIAAQATANARACPRTNCVIVRVLNRGEAITTVGEVVGDNVQGSNNWTRVLLNGRETFVHSALVSRTRPQPLPAEQAQPVQQQPGQGLQVQPTSDTRNAYRGLNCTEIRDRFGDGNFTPGHPAYNRSRDRDDDGIACELG
ncbi:MAG: excalibur calcium-binding domain-containing protein [Anaerolineaceae bacterium]|nr:excalibur calcium-binding domain-containing protein [Anaerolineaceae bacterium]